MFHKIAFIDNEKEVLDSLKWIFKDEPYQLYTFQNPTEAIDKIAEEEFAVVVSDHLTPEMEGISLLAQIKKRHPRTECLIMAGHDTADKVRRMDHPVINKPWNIRELKDVIHKAIAQYEGRDCETGGDLSTGRKTILYVDNEKEMINLVTQLLERMGYKVVGTDWCSKAIRLFQSQPDMFDLVITDLKMPDMDGLELTRKVLEFRPDIPVILCTGFGDVLDRESLEVIGIKELLAKPFSMEDMAKTIKETLGDG